MRGRRGTIAVALLVAACGSGAATTTTGATTTTTVASTTTLPATPTSTTVVETTTTTVAAVEGVPEEALALIGSPMPEVPEYPDGFDAELWFEAYAAWNQWAFANPVEGLESLDLWVVPGSELSGSTRDRLEAWVDHGRSTVRTGNLVLLSFEVADELGSDGVLILNVETAAEGAAWILEGGAVVAQQEFDDSEVRRSFIGVEEGPGGWRVSSWSS